ncbi:MAG: hypothetical protein F6J87_18345 [Spirulina sp. SIO3F2]|nr:hypothetical protein [Spirulina sp. SIO3F2]
MPTVDAFGTWENRGAIVPIAYQWKRPGTSSTLPVSVFRLTVEGTADGKHTKLWLRWRYGGASGVKNTTRASLWYPDKEAAIWLPYEAPRFFREQSRPLEKELEAMLIPLRRSVATNYQIRVEELIA